MITVNPYTQQCKRQWDEFVENSKNGTFLFIRDYMEYHSDRFVDLSLMFYEDNALIAVMPANVSGDAVFSHGGLTYGGIISDYRMKTTQMIDVFNAFRVHFAQRGLKKLTYKPIPHIYHLLPAEEDLYAIYLLHGTVVKRDISSTVYLNNRIPYSKGRKWMMKKAASNVLTVRQSFAWEEFMAIEEKNLMEKHAVRPTHRASEIRLLAERFPNNIKLFCSYKAEQMLAGVIIYESKSVAHAQYISATEEGKALGALDVIIDHLIQVHYADKTYFDFGISTTEDGRTLNGTLIRNKESFGARGTIYESYEVDLTKQPSSGGEEAVDYRVPNH